jgi:hypothetical protein
MVPKEWTAMPADHAIRPGRRWGGAGFRLGMGVAAWWLLAGGAVALMLPAPAVERAAFDLAQRAYRESDEAMLEDAFSAYEWIAVTHRQEVLVVTVDGDVVEVELFDGAYAGRRGWLKAWELAP